MAVEFHKPIWLIGCGNMAGAMLEGWLAAGADPALFTAIRPSGAPVAGGVRVLTALPDEPPPAMAVLGVKPQKLGEVAPLLAPRLASDTIVVSLLAGVDQAALRDAFPIPRAIVRAMPNTPVALRRGVISLCADEAGSEARAAVQALMATLGHVEWINDETLFDAVSALAGSGPAFLFRFVDAMARAGADLGLGEDQAARLALATVAGAGALADASDQSPAALAERVASPGGMTRAGLDVLDGEGRLDALLRETITAAARRGRDLAAAAALTGPPPAPIRPQDMDEQGPE